MLDSTCNAIGNFIATALLYPTYTIFMATAFLPFFLLDPYIRTFVSGCQPHSCHRHFIDPRPIDRTIHLWTAFHICLTALFGRFSADFNVLCQRRILHSFASNVVSGERFRAYPIIPLFRISVRENSVFPATFTSLQAFAHIKFICSNVSLHDRRTPSALTAGAWFSARCRRQCWHRQ